MIPKKLCKAKNIKLAKLPNLEEFSKKWIEEYVKPNLSPISVEGTHAISSADKAAAERLCDRLVK